MRRTGLRRRARKVPCERLVPVRERKMPNRSSVRSDEAGMTGIVAVRGVYVGYAMKGEQQ